MSRTIVAVVSRVGARVMSQVTIVRLRRAPGLLAVASLIVSIGIRTALVEVVLVRVVTVNIERPAALLPSQWTIEVV